MSQNNMLACLDTVMRMIICRDADDSSCLSVRPDAPSGDLKYSLKDVAATAINSKYVHFKCALNAQMCTNHHMVMLPESKSCYGSAKPPKVEHVVDTKVIIGCLDRALQRGAWEELYRFVVTDTFRALRIVVTPATIVDDEDDENRDVDANLRLQVAAALEDKAYDQLTMKATASYRRMIERHRAKAAQQAHIALAVTGQMFRYQVSLTASNPYAPTHSK